MSIKIASMNFGDCDTILHNTPNGMKNIAEVLGPNGEVYWSATKEFTGIPPLSIRSNGTMLLDYLISGNMTCTGTPTPQNPVDVNGTGDRTGNLLPEFYATSGEISGNSYTITKNSIETHNDGSYLGSFYVLTEFKRSANYANYVIIDEQHSFKIPAGTYTFSGNENIHSYYNGLRLIVGQLGQAVSGASVGAINVGVGRTFTINADSYVCPVLEIRYDSLVDEYILTNPILNTGSTAKPYEPYGYKIPISSANTTTPVYLGQVQSTRRIKKLVLTGEEGWVRTSNERCYYINSAKGCPNDYLKSNIVTVMCSHYEGQRNTRSGSPEVNKGCICFFTGISGFELYIGERTITSAENFKTYLQQQYATGTPVTVWYVLATETTGIVNEPIRKIGGYADTLSYKQAGVQIPTNRGNTVIDVDTTLKPSEMYIKYK